MGEEVKTMMLYETIFTRRSVRQYDKTPLDNAELAEIQQILDSAKHLSEQSARFEIVKADRFRLCSAPHAILAYAGENDFALANIGYVLQGVDLYLQSKGYGSLWSATARPKEPQNDYRILLAFGNTKSPLRGGESDFKRKPVLEISNEDCLAARTARLSPSANNLQPWKLDFTPGKVIVQFYGKGIGKLIMGKLHKIDLGIVLKHTELALEHDGKTITTITPKNIGKAFAIEIAYD
jgi:nitroreductase